MKSKALPISRNSPFKLSHITLQCPDLYLRVPTVQGMLTSSSLFMSDASSILWSSRILYLSELYVIISSVSLTSSLAYNVLLLRKLISMLQLMFKKQM